MKVTFTRGKPFKQFPWSVIISEWDIYFSEQTPMLQHFEYYQGHFAVLQGEMERWRPRTFRELLQPGYNDRFTWYATMFSIVIAAIGIIGIVTSIIQTVVAFNAFKLQQLQSGLQ
jgi:hypothetical protein